MKTKAEREAERPARVISEFRNTRRSVARRDAGFDVVFEFAPDPAAALEAQARAVRVALDRGRL